MDDISLCIDKIVKRGLHKAAILLAIRSGWTALATLLASCHERDLTRRERIEIVTAFAVDGNRRAAFELTYRWHVRRRLPYRIREFIDEPRDLIPQHKPKEERPNETEKRWNKDGSTRDSQPVRRAG